MRGEPGDGRDGTLALPPPPLIVPKKKKKRGLPPATRRRISSYPPHPVSLPDGRLTDGAPRLEVLKELGGQLVLGLGGALMLGFGVVLGWMTVAGLRRGWFDDGDQIVYASQEPVWFYSSTIIVSGMALLSGWLGPQMLHHAWGERRYTAWLVGRLVRGEREPR
jgi:hypothetical protein